MLDELVNRVQVQVLREADLTKEVSDGEIRQLIRDTARKTTGDYTLSLAEREEIEQRVFNSLRRLDVIQELVEDDEVTEIMVNGPKHIFYEKGGQIYEWHKQFSSEEKLVDVIQRIVGNHNRVVNLSSPIVDSRLPDGSRINAVLAPVAIGGSVLTIRKFAREEMTLEKLVQGGSLTKEAASYLIQSVESGKCIVVSGGTGSGKTTFLNALSAYIPKTERVITIEDSAELQLRGVKNLVQLETRNTNQGIVSEISIRDLIKTALRMRPDRLIVGECRGAEAFDMLQAINTGHPGSMSTAHSNSCRDLISRLEMMVRMGMDLPIEVIQSQIASGIQIIVHLSRMKDRSRKVVEIARINGIREGNIQLESVFLRKEGELERQKASI